MRSRPTFGADLNERVSKPLILIPGMDDPGAGDREIRELPPVGRGAPMPRYFFRVIDGRDIIDSEGTELPSLRAARTEAIQLAGAILHDEGDEFWNGTEWHRPVRAQAPFLSR